MNTTQKHYNKECEDYDEGRVTGSPISKYLNEIEQEMIVKHFVGKRVLELCCGTGRFAKNIVGRGYEYIGIDFSKGMLSKARAKKVPHTKFIQMDVRRIGAMNMKFDNIFVARAMKFWPDAQQTIYDCYKLLNKNGRLILSFMNRDHPIFRLIYFLSTKFGLKIRKIRIFRCQHVGNEQYYLKKDVINMLDNAGFKIIYKRSYLNFAFYTFFHTKWMANFVRRYDNKFNYGWRNVIVGVKK